MGCGSAGSPYLDCIRGTKTLFFAYARENSPVQPLTVETIMVGSNLTILDQIAKFFLLLSDAPSYWFILNTSCDHAFHLSKRLGMDESDSKALLIAGNLAR